MSQSPEEEDKMFDGQILDFEVVTGLFDSIKLWNKRTGLEE